MRFLTVKRLLGSPPHTREHFTLGLTLGLKQGITPAYAGTLSEGVLRELTEADHPRIRGNTEHTRQIAQLSVGSPPHTREHSWQRLVCSDDTGITPAYAGTLTTVT